EDLDDLVARPWLRVLSLNPRVLLKNHLLSGPGAPLVSECHSHCCAWRVWRGIAKLRLSGLSHPGDQEVIIATVQNYEL
ncbi:hypothetical protein AVEN_134487-1, partial [Araneus ventricosus]